MTNCPSAPSHCYQRLAHSIAETCVLARAGRTAVYEAINSGKLIAHKRGARTIILAGDLQRWIEALPKIEVKHPKQECEVVSRTVSSKGRMARHKDSDSSAVEKLSAREDRNVA